MNKCPIFGRSSVLFLDTHNFFSFWVLCAFFDEVIDGCPGPRYLVRGEVLGHYGGQG